MSVGAGIASTLGVDTAKRRTTLCGEKTRAQKAVWRKQNRDKVNKNNLAAYHKQKEKDPEGFRRRLERTAQWQKDHPESFARSQLRGKLGRYGLSIEDYNALLEAQGGLCAICGQAETMKRGGVTWDLSVDHDHDTGVVRGLLCIACNHGLGRFRDDPRLLEAAIAYLRRHERVKSSPASA